MYRVLSTVTGQPVLYGHDGADVLVLTCSAVRKFVMLTGDRSYSLMIQTRHNGEWSDAVIIGIETANRFSREGLLFSAAWGQHEGL